MKKYFLLIFLSALLLACQNISKPIKPENLIAREVMVDILVDSYLSNAARSKAFQEIRDENLRLELYIYKKYAIDSLQFAQSNAYYSSDLDSYEKMLSLAEEKLQALKDKEEETKQLEKPNIIEDSEDEES